MQKNSTNKFYYKNLGFSVCGATKTKPSVWTYFARIFCMDFCTDFLRGFFARIFCTDFFARIFLHGFLHGFLDGFVHEFLHGFFARIHCTNHCAEFLPGFFARISWGVPKHLLRSAKNPPRKSPRKFSMLWGPSGEGLGRQESEVETLANLTKASLGLGGLRGGTSGGSSLSSGLEPRFQKARSKSCQAKDC